ncbi:MAG: glycoside hydrolase family 13 protein [Acidimicrobiales bacterium]
MAESNSSTPDWVADAVFYQIFPDRFARSGRVDVGAKLEDWDEPPSFEGYKGGDLWGVIDRLDHLVELGITAIWFNPIFQSASNHRYHTHDYFRVDPMLGGEAAFDALVEACHTRGIRVVLDGVFNHASRGFFQFSDVAEHGDKSAYRDWFTVDSFPIRPYDVDTPPTYEAWWGMHALPELNTDNPQVAEYLWSVGEYWMHRGIDGWRLDVPNEISTPDFWEGFRRRVKAINPEAYLVGEIWHAAPEWVGDANRFDGVMNYKLTTAIIAFAVGNRIDRSTLLANPDYDVTPGLSAGGFADRIDWLTWMYPPATQRAMLNLLDSHDTARIRTIARGDRSLVELALSLLFVMPGAPCLYYGTEVGMEGGPDPDCRRGFPWADPDDWDTNTLAVVRRLIELRRAEPALRSTEIERLGPPAGADFGRTWVVGRGAGADRLIVAVNHADEPDDVPMPVGTVAAEAERVFGTARLVESSAFVAAGPTTTMVMPPRSVGIWRAPR